MRTKPPKPPTARDAARERMEKEAAEFLAMTPEARAAMLADAAERANKNAGQLRAEAAANPELQRAVQATGEALRELMARPGMTIEKAMELLSKELVRKARKP